MGNEVMDSLAGEVKLDVVGHIGKSPIIFPRYDDGAINCHTPHTRGISFYSMREYNFFAEALTRHAQRKGNKKIYLAPTIQQIYDAITTTYVDDAHIHLSSFIHNIEYIDITTSEVINFHNKTLRRPKLDDVDGRLVHAGIEEVPIKTEGPIIDALIEAGVLKMRGTPLRSGELYTEYADAQGDVILGFRARFSGNNIVVAPGCDDKLDMGRALFIEVDESSGNVNHTATRAVIGDQIKRDGVEKLYELSKKDTKLAQELHELMRRYGF